MANKIDTCFRADRSWGREYLISICFGFYTVKVLEIFPSGLGGLQFHHLKSECGLVLKGKMLLRTQEKSSDVTIERTLCQGDFFVLPAGLIHQEQAIESTLILEISSPHLNDRVRLDKCSNSPNLLPSTTPSEVVTLSTQNDLSNLARLGFMPVQHSEIPSEIRLIAN